LKTIHLINDFNSNFYLDLFSNFKKNDHLVLSSYRVKKHKLNNDYRNLNVIHKYFKNRVLVLSYFFTIIKIYKKKSTIIHTHNSSFEGILALLCKKILGIEFVFTIRNTDISKTIKNKLGVLFFNYILSESKYIVLKTKAYQDFIEEKHQSKIKFIPNGLNQFWIDNFTFEKSKVVNPINIICVADFYYNKNHKNLFTAIESINKTKVVCKLTLVARDQGDCIEEVFKKIKNSEYIHFKGALKKQELLEEYRNADIFCMNSFYETFGLVYLEALSQQLPIIYTLNQGVDGLIPKNYGEGCSTDSLSIEKAILNQINNINNKNYTQVSKEFINSFDWKKIALDYEKLYR